jgi:hypothetical protein
MFTSLAGGVTSPSNTVKLALTFLLSIMVCLLGIMVIAMADTMVLDGSTYAELIKDIAVSIAQFGMAAVPAKGIRDGIGEYAREMAPEGATP